ncbi:SDR family oxidoreductase [Nonomuraea thailandensis]
MRALTAEGVRVAAAARTTSPALEETGAVILTADLSTPEGPAEVIGRAAAELGGIDLLVNNVGGGDADATLVGGFLTVSDEAWHQVHELNLLSAVRAACAAMPDLLRRHGTVINISSNSARLPSMGPIAYATAKAALTAFGKALAEEFGPQGVRVNTVSPEPCSPRCGRPPTGTAPRWPRPTAWTTNTSWRGCRRTPG